jgi:hypothetical protein
MADKIITIDASGNPNPSYQTVVYNDRVQWNAAVKNKTWYITFSPFKAHVIKTDAKGETPFLDVGRHLGSCAYQINDSDPRLLQEEKHKILTSGGGIIVDA